MGFQRKNEPESVFTDFKESKRKVLENVDPTFQFRIFFILAMQGQGTLVADFSALPQPFLTRDRYFCECVS